MSGCGVKVKNALERADAKESSEFDGVNAVALVAGGMELVMSLRLITEDENMVEMECAPRSCGAVEVGLPWCFQARKLA
jgi:hypothetical protein